MPDQLISHHKSTTEYLIISMFMELHGEVKSDQIIIRTFLDARNTLQVTRMLLLVRGHISAQTFAAFNPLNITEYYRLA